MTALTFDESNFLSLDAGERGYRTYLRQIHAIPLLTAEEEVALFKRYQEFNDMSAVKRLVLAHLRMVVSIAAKFYGYGLDKKDLIQEGNIGLLKSIKAFKLGKKARFGTYALSYVRGAIIDFIVRNWTIVKIATTKAQRKLFLNMRELFMVDQEGKLLSADEVSRKMAVRPEDVRQMRERVTFFRHPWGGETQDLVENVRCPRNSIERDLIERKDNCQHLDRLRVAFDSLNSRERDIIQARFLGEEKTKLKVLAARYNISIEAVSRAEERALKKLRGELAA